MDGKHLKHGWTESRLVRHWPICLMLIIGLGLVVSRAPIRIQWWEWRLRHAQTDAQRLHYFHLLGSMGPSAIGAAKSLLVDQDPSLRGMGVGILQQIDSPQTTELLRKASKDPDPQVRELAIFGLAMHRNPDVVPMLRERVWSDDVTSCRAAVAALGSYGCETSSSTLERIVREHSSALVRAEAIEQLAAMRCSDSIPILIEALDDLEPYDGSTTYEELDRVVEQWYQRQHSETAEKPIEVVKGRTVADRAGMALRQITGQTIEFDSTWDETRRNESREQWWAWWANRRSSGTATDSPSEPRP